MKIPLLWLSDYVELTLPPKEMAHRLSMAGAEVEEVVDGAADWEGVSVGLVTAVEPHPNADRLRLATVDAGEGEPQTVVCGAPNVATGQKIAFAREGALLVDAHSGEKKRLRKSKIRGVVSAGMVCSERELGISDEHEGILVLDPEAPVGLPLAQALARIILARSALEVSPTPNRPDHLSILGIARELAALTGQTVREAQHDHPADGPPVEERTRVDIEAPDLCPRYIAAVITGVRVGPSPSWMQEALLGAGQRPINNIVDVTNYVMLELGQPLHAFDFDKLGGGRIIVRRAKPGERIRLIDESEHELTPDNLVIADANEAVAVAGVMGSGPSEVSEHTTTVLLESATFHGPNIRRTAAGIKRRSEASLRFEKGLHPQLAWVASQRATRLLLETAGGVADTGIVDAYPGETRPVTVELTRGRLQQILGVDVPVERVRSILESLGFGARWVPPEKYIVRVPYWRTDVRIPDDVAEEIARIIGYDTLPSDPLRGALPEPLVQPGREVVRAATDALVEAGLLQVINYSVISIERLARVQPPESVSARPPLALHNPMSADRTVLRPSLRPGLLENYAANWRQRHGPLGLFEVGKVFHPREDDLPDERTFASALYGGDTLPDYRQGKARSVDLSDAKGVAESFAEALGIAITYEPGEDPALLPGHAAWLHVDGESVGVLGRVHPDVLGRFEIEDDVYLFEIDVDALAPVARRARAFAAPSRFPTLAEDLAVVVDAATSAAAVEAVLRRPRLVESVRLFDLYTGDPVPAGKKSLAYTITYRAPDRTLTDADVAKVRAGVVRQLERELGASIREG